MILGESRDPTIARLIVWHGIPSPSLASIDAKALTRPDELQQLKDRVSVRATDK
jgi:hypothetical protein